MMRFAFGSGQVASPELAPGTQRLASLSGSWTAAGSAAPRRFRPHAASLIPTVLRPPASGVAAPGLATAVHDASVPGRDFIAHQSHFHSCLLVFIRGFFGSGSARLGFRISGSMFTMIDFAGDSTLPAKQGVTYRPMGGSSRLSCDESWGSPRVDLLDSFKGALHWNLATDGIQRRSLFYDPSQSLLAGGFPRPLCVFAPLHLGVEFSPHTHGLLPFLFKILSRLQGKIRLNICLAPALGVSYPSFTRRNRAKGSLKSVCSNRVQNKP